MHSPSYIPINSPEPMLKPHTIGSCPRARLWPVAGVHGNIAGKNVKARCKVLGKG